MGLTDVTVCYVCDWRGPINQFYRSLFFYCLFYRLLEKYAKSRRLKSRWISSTSSIFRSRLLYTWPDSTVSRCSLEPDFCLQRNRYVRYLELTIWVFHIRVVRFVKLFTFLSRSGLSNLRFSTWPRNFPKEANLLVTFFLSSKRLIHYEKEISRN